MRLRYKEATPDQYAKIEKLRILFLAIGAGFTSTLITATLSPQH